MQNFEYTVTTSKGFDEAVTAVEAKTAEKGFRVLHTHDVAATLAEKGLSARAAQDRGNLQRTLCKRSAEERCQDLPHAALPQ